MMKRREFVAAIAATAFAPATARAQPLPDPRPPRSERTFSSPAVEAELLRVKAKIGDPELAWMFANAFPNTLDTTVRLTGSEPAPDAFLLTGDIPALWLRDSACQVAPYVHLAQEDPALRRLFRGLIGRHARSILIDPYANAFMQDPGARTTLEWALADDTEMRPGVAERKWEIDSLAHAMRLATTYWRATGDPQPFDATWRAAMARAVDTLRAQQRLHGNGPYRFTRKSANPLESLPNGGWGAPTRPVGLIHSGFRPSDDACTFPFLIPANLFAASALRGLAATLRAMGHAGPTAADAVALAAQVEAAVTAHGMLREGSAPPVLAYEVDGFGDALFMDDANAPSLCSLAYLGALPRTSPLFRNTQARAWSARNPFYRRGRIADGLGSPHTSDTSIWPMSLIMRALSSDDDADIRLRLRQLKASHAGTGFIHESFDQDDASRFTRPWFAWANSLFAELILDLAARRPALLAERL